MKKKVAVLMTVALVVLGAVAPAAVAKQTPPHNPPNTTPGHTGNTV